MEEGELIKILLLIGIVSISIIYLSYFFMEKSVLNFASYFMPYIFCEQDYKGEFILGKRTSSEVCNKIDEIKSLINYEICNNYFDEKREACINLVEIAKKREEDCRDIFFRKTSVAEEEVERYCKIFNITREVNYTSILF